MIFKFNKINVVKTKTSEVGDTDCVYRGMNELDNNKC